MDINNMISFFIDDVSRWPEFLMEDISDGLQVLSLIFFLIAGIAFIWMSRDNKKVRENFVAQLPNHLVFLLNHGANNMQNEENTTENTDLTTNRVNEKTRKRQFIDESRWKRQNVLPPTLVPYGSRVVTPMKEDLLRTSNELHDTMRTLPTRTQTTQISKPKAPEASPKSSDLFKSIQKESEKLYNDSKKAEKERKKKEREAKEAAAREKEQKLKEAAEKEAEAEAAKEKKGGLLGNALKSSASINLKIPGSTPSLNIPPVTSSPASGAPASAAPTGTSSTLPKLGGTIPSFPKLGATK